MQAHVYGDPGPAIIRLPTLGSTTTASFWTLPAEELRCTPAGPRRHAEAARLRGRAGASGEAGAYYQRILLALLEDHQVFVPKLGEGDLEKIDQLAMQSFRDAEEGLEKKPGASE